jgi:hypothetical protein
VIPQELQRILGVRMSIMNDLQTDSWMIGRVVRPGKTALDRRWATAWAVQLHLLGAPVCCLMEDVSVDGAKLRLPEGVDAAIEEHGSLAFSKHTPMPVRIAWRRDDRIGVQFATRQTWLVDLVVQATETHDWPPPLGR